MLRIPRREESDRRQWFQDKVDGVDVGVDDWSSFVVEDVEDAGSYEHGLSARGSMF
jgi:hypothetical protein